MDNGTSVTVFTEQKPRCVAVRAAGQESDMGSMEYVTTLLPTTPRACAT